MQDRFRRIEQEYYTLRGQFAVGRLSESDFDTALRALAIEDGHGRVWMIGANTGQWYYSNGESWFQGDPYQSNVPRRQPLARSDAAEPPNVLDQPPPPGFEPEESVGGQRLALPFVVIAVVLLLVAAIVFFLFNSAARTLFNPNPFPTGTRIARAATAASVANASTRTLPTPEVTGDAAEDSTPIPVTTTPSAEQLASPAASPMVIVLEPTEPLPEITVIPTITPGGPQPTENQAPAETDAADVPTAEPSTPASSPPDTQGLAPDVYITNISISPDPPRQRQELTFTASFLNTNPQGVGMEWRIVMLDPAKQGRSKDWGQSELAGITVPPGRSEFFIKYIPVTSTGPCVQLQALVARRLEDNGRFILPGTNGAPYAATYNFC